MAILRCTLGILLSFVTNGWRALLFHLLRWIRWAVWAFITLCASSILALAVQKLAEAKHWDMFLIQYWDPITFRLTALMGSLWFWFFFGHLVGIVLGIRWSKLLTKAEARETSLQIDYEVTAANKVETNTDVFIRARVRNIGPGTANNARVFLTSLRAVQPAGATTPTSFHDSKALAWAGGGFKPQDLPSSPDHHFYVDLMRVSKHHSGWIFCVQQVFPSQNDLKNYKGTLRFKLSLTADNTKPATCEVDVTYYGDWHYLDAVAVP